MKTLKNILCLLILYILRNFIRSFDLICYMYRPFFDNQKGRPTVFIPVCSHGKLAKTIAVSLLSYAFFIISSAPLVFSEETIFIEFGASSVMTQSSLSGEDAAYNPSEKTVTLYEKVTWINNDEFEHTVTSGEADNPTSDFDSDIIRKDGNFSQIFGKEGKYPYYCTLHPFMTGEIIVNNTVG